MLVAPARILALRDDHKWGTQVVMDQVSQYMQTIRARTLVHHSEVEILPFDAAQSAFS
ncbi:MAG: hypothetical protein WCA38_07885 [Candidatus Acidiferrales bacterium]